MKVFKPLSEHIGRKIRKRRHKAGMSLADLSRKLGVSIYQVEKYELGINRVSIEVLYKLKQIFKVSPNFFFDNFDYKAELASEFFDPKTINLDNKKELNVLLVENDPEDEFIIRKFIEDCPHPSNIYAVHDGKRALEVLRNKEYTPLFLRADLILLDLNFPNKDGITVLKEIKRDSRIQDIPVVIITNCLKRDGMIEAYKKYASGYIYKSANLDVFKSQIEALIHYWSFAVILPRMN
jgi:CheY-like chemotaxis protein